MKVTKKGVHMGKLLAIPALIIAFALTSGTTFACTSTSGGVKRIWMQTPEDFVFVQNITYDYTAITTLSGAKFFEFQFKEGEAQYQDKINVTDGAQSFTHTLTFAITRRTQTLRNIIMDLANCSACDGLVVIFEEYTGTVWVGGELPQQRFRLGDGTAADSGKKILDRNFETIVMTAETTEKLNTFSAGVGAIPV